MIAALMGSLLNLSYPWNWEAFGAATPAATAAAWSDVMELAREDIGCMIGVIFSHANTTPPIGSLACDGATHNRVDYPDLYDSLDAAFIVDGSTFRTPDLRGRAVIGVGQGAGLTDRAIDSAGGEETHTLSATEMPAHQHLEIAAQGGPALAGEIPTAYLTFNIQQLTTSAGGGLAHENMSPWRALRYAIWAR